MPDRRLEEAMTSLALASARADGLTLAKWRVRLLHSKRIAKMLPWEAERLLDVRPDLAEMDIEPMVNISCNGGNALWMDTPHGGRPVPGRWLNRDPESAEYKAAVAANYWCKGHHPRSEASRRAWYLRNGGAYMAWQRGVVVDIGRDGVERWEGKNVQVITSGEAWIVKGYYTLNGMRYWRYRKGFGIDNVVLENNVQNWYPVQGYALKAPATWSSLPNLEN